MGSTLETENALLHNPESSLKVKYCTIDSFVKKLSTSLNADSKQLRFIDEMQEFSEDIFYKCRSVVAYVCYHRTVIGFALVLVRWEKSVEIIRFAVDKRWQRKHIGSKILASIKRKSSGVDLVAASFAVTRFYRKNGFDGDGKSMYWIRKRKIKTDFFGKLVYRLPDEKTKT